MADAFEEQIKAIEAANSSEASEMEPPVEAEEPAQEEPPETETEGTKEAADEPLELTEDDEAVEADEGDDEAEEDQDDEGNRRRSKPAKQRIAEVTAQKHEERRMREAAEQRAAELEKRIAALENGNTENVDEPPARPDPKEFEYGESDPAYIEKLTDWKVETYRHEQKVAEGERAKSEKQQATQRQMIEHIQTGVAKAEAEAKEKYTDFDERIAEAVESRGGEAMPPILTVGIGTSPVGGDLLYRMATDADVSERLETLARNVQNNPRALAMALGEIEAEYLDDMSDADLNPDDQADAARMMGRMRARAAGRKAPPVTRDAPVTEAPEPPAKRTKGGGGRPDVPVDTEDTKAFMRQYGKRLGL